MTKAVSFSGKMLVFSRLILTISDIDEIIKKVTDVADDEQIPVIIDSSQTLDLKTLKERLWSLGIVVIGVVEGVLDEQAKELQLAILPNDGTPITRIEENKTDDALLVNRHTVIHQALVRSGQQIYHMDGDLVILDSVRNGAEVASGSNLYIYGTAGGRLVAGATGDKNAFIICQDFDPLLVSVAGTYCLRENIPHELINKAVMISFDATNEGLKFDLITPQNLPTNIQ